MNNSCKCLARWLQVLIKSLPLPHTVKVSLYPYKGKKLPYRKAVGTKGEQIAVRFLRKNGYKILQRNYTYRGGEIDIIGYDRGVVVFVEVKTRHSDTYGPPELSITELKKKHMIKGALRYIMEKKIQDREIRFDVISIFYSQAENYPKITLFKNAFTKDHL
ncbi:MAG: YraN family protein [wastewater metagenome]|nr:YraN family protein [Candidatus Loosdrechtia aerotolerans]